MEHFQDAASLTGDKIELIQHKYSARETPIAPGELYEIWLSLQQSADLAKGEGLDLGNLCLHTNRPLGPDALKVVEASQKAQPHDEFSRKEYKDERGKKRFKNRSVKLSQEYGKTLKDIVLKPVDICFLHHRLESAANEFGVKPGRETSEAVDRAIALLLRISGKPVPRQITSGQLESAFVDCPAPRKLCSASVKSTMEKDLKANFKSSGFDGELVPRDAGAVIDALHTSALVVLYGKGGRGKTVTALSCLSRQIEAKEDFPPPFVAFESADKVGGQFLAELFGKWRNSRRNIIQEAISETVERLCRACNSNTGTPTLMLSLDGLDELTTEDERRHVLELLSHFRDEDQRCREEQTEPVVKLIVTCREQDEIDLWINRSGMPLEWVPQKIEIIDLVEAEVLRSTRSLFPQTLRRWFDSLQAPRFGDNEPVGPIRRAGTAEIDQRMRRSLLHPPILGCFRHLEHDLALAALEGKEPGCEALSKLYVNWFVHKAWRRKHRIDPAHCRDALRLLATKTNLELGEFQYSTDWKDPIKELVGETTARNLFSEAISSGLIESERRNVWAWSHPLCLLSLLENDS